MNKFLKVFTGLALLAIVYFFYKYLDLYAQQSKSQLNICLNTATDNYNTYLAKQCKAYENKNDPACSLPANYADPVNNALEQEQDNCFRKYPQ